MKKPNEPKPEASPTTETSENNKTPDSGTTEPATDPIIPVDEPVTEEQEVEEPIGVDLASGEDVTSSALVVIDPTPLPVHVALLLMRQWAIENGHNLYVRCPADLNAPGGDGYSVRTVEEETEDGDVVRFIVVIREPSSYQVGAAQNRLQHLRNELADAIKTAKTARVQLEAAPKDPAIADAARDRIADAKKRKKAIEDEIEELEATASAQETQTWRFPADLAGIELFASGAA